MIVYVRFSNKKIIVTIIMSVLHNNMTVHMTVDSTISRYSKGHKGQHRFQVRHNTQIHDTFHFHYVRRFWLFLELENTHTTILLKRRCCILPTNNR